LSRRRRKHGRMRWRWRQHKSAGSIGGGSGGRRAEAQPRSRARKSAHRRVSRRRELRSVGGRSPRRPLLRRRRRWRRRHPHGAPVRLERDGLGEQAVLRAERKVGREAGRVPRRGLGRLPQRRAALGGCGVGVGQVDDVRQVVADAVEEVGEAVGEAVPRRAGQQRWRQRRRRRRWRRGRGRRGRGCCCCGWEGGAAGGRLRARTGCRGHCGGGGSRVGRNRECRLSAFAGKLSGRQHLDQRAHTPTRRRGGHAGLRSRQGVAGRCSSGGEGGAWRGARLWPQQPVGVEW
jgi:hypothetical protein